MIWEIEIEAPAGSVMVPAVVVVKAGATSVDVEVRALQAGVEEVTLRPRDGAFEVVRCRIRVNP